MNVQIRVTSNFNSAPLRFLPVDQQYICPANLGGLYDLLLLNHVHETTNPPKKGDVLLGYLSLLPRFLLRFLYLPRTASMAL